MDFINYLKEGYQQFLWLGIAVLGVVWLIVLYLLFKQRNVYGILWLAVTILAGVVIWSGWHSYVQAREAKLVVLIAKFDGPEEVYGLRNEILEKLNADFANDTEVAIESINEVITPDSKSGSPRAVELGKSYQADVVIWGWYRPTENPNITIHIENLIPEQLTLLEKSSTLHPVTTLEDLESFTFQQQAGQETSALLFFMTGYISFKAGKYNDAIARFDNALASTDEMLLLNNRAKIYLYRGTSHYLLKQYNHAVPDFTKAIELDPNDADAYNNRGSAYQDLGEYDQAIQDYSKSIELDPNSAVAYNNRGTVYCEPTAHS
jgi:tetratricopeptide (TPR) repeat protein